MKITGASHQLPQAVCIILSGTMKASQQGGRFQIPSNLISLYDLELLILLSLPPKCWDHRQVLLYPVMWWCRANWGFMDAKPTLCWPSDFPSPQCVRGDSISHEVSFVFKASAFSVLYKKYFPSCSLTPNWRHMRFQKFCFILLFLLLWLELSCNPSLKAL